MSSNYNNLDLGSLKALLIEKRASIEGQPCDIPSGATRAVYNDMKALQYEISIREAQEAPPIDR